MEITCHQSGLLQKNHSDGKNDKYLLIVFEISIANIANFFIRRFRLFGLGFLEPKKKVMDVLK
jgi:hypothetical protein